MGDWADMYDYGYEPRNAKPHKEVRNLTWNCKDGSEISIGDMTDRHLLNAYKMFGDEDLFKEMVVRLFEAKATGEQQ
jgi:hypothetical protein